MPLIYAVVSRGGVPLCENAEAHGNFVAVARRVLQKLHEKECELSYNGNLNAGVSVTPPVAGLGLASGKLDNLNFPPQGRKQPLLGVDPHYHRDPDLDSTQSFASTAASTTVLNDSSSHSKNFNRSDRDQLYPELRRHTYIYDDYLFHFLVEKNPVDIVAQGGGVSIGPTGERARGIGMPIVYLVLAERESGRRVPFAFLDAMRTEFREKFGSIRESVEMLGLQREFKGEIGKLLESFNSGHADAITRARAQINEIHDIMIENIDKILARQERIDLLVEKAETLNRDAMVFRRDATELSNVMWWRNCKVVLWIVLTVGLIVFLVVWWHCGFKFDKC